MRHGLAGLLVLALAACAGEEEGFVSGPVEGFAGIVAADEPRAAMVGRDILANGGSASDAAVAMYFTMAVTLPSRVGLAGGGACLAFDRRTGDAYLVDFMARSGELGGVVPRGVRGMAVLHARGGLNRWGALVGPAESYARFGHRASRVLTRDLAAARAKVLADPALARLFTTASGALVREGDRVEQIALSSVLGGVRNQGAGFFHGGSFVERYAAASGSAGLPVTGQEFRKAVPTVDSPETFEFDSETLYFPKMAGEQAAAAALWRLLEEGGYASADPDERAGLFLEAGAAATGSGGGMPDRSLAEGRSDGSDGKAVLALRASETTALLAPQAGPATVAVEDGPSPGAGFVAGDRRGNAVACAMTMNGLFGSGRMAGDTGLLLAAAPKVGEQPVGLAILANRVSGEGHLAMSAAGGNAAQSALVRVLLGHLVEEQGLAAAVAAPRLHPSAPGGEVFYEPGVTRGTIDALRVQGHGLRPAVGLGLVEAFHCREGLADSDKGCEWASDPRGTGLATVVR